MKTLCCACNDYMEYENHEPVGEGSVGIMFKCAKCGNQFQLIINAGESMLVHAMGVKVGGSKIGYEPLELTRSTLVENGDEAERTTSIGWSSGARERVSKIPQFVRPFAVQSIEDYALQSGHAEITEQVLDEYKATEGHM